MSASLPDYNEYILAYNAGIQLLNAQVI